MMKSAPAEPKRPSGFYIGARCGETSRITRSSQGDYVILRTIPPGCRHKPYRSDHYTRTVDLIHQSGRSQVRRRAAAAASPAVSNRAKTVAPEPDMRVRRAPGRA